LARSYDGLTLLHYAALSNHAATMQLVLDVAILRNPELRTLEAYTPLHYAGHISLPVLLCNGADMDAVTRDGVPPLQKILDRHDLPARGAEGYRRVSKERKEINAVWNAEKDRRSLPQTHCFLQNLARFISSKHLQTRHNKNEKLMCWCCCVAAPVAKPSQWGYAKGSACDLSSTYFNPRS